MKKIISLLLILLVVTLSACSNCNGFDTKSDSQQAISTGEKPSGEEKDITFILSRNIFVFKDSTPDVYYIFNDIDTVIPYADNWKYEQILNEKNFSNIEWSTEEIDEDERVITFSGKSKHNSDIWVSFYIQDSANVPLAISMKCIDADSSSSLINIQSLMDTGMEYEQAMVMTDVSISTLVALMGDNPLGDSTVNNEKSQQAYSVEELLGKSAAEIISIYGQGYIEVVPDGDPPYFYYEVGDPYLFVGNAQSTQITSIKAHKEGCGIIPGVYIGDNIVTLEAVVTNSGKYVYYPASNWYYGADGEYGWVSFKGSGVHYSCYVENKTVVSFECWIDEENNLTQKPSISTNYSFDRFVNGTWWDLWSQRCNLKMDVLDNETVQIEINWSGGAAYNTVWHITGKWDANTERLNYENGIMLDVEYVEGQQDAKILRDYADGTGYFYFKDGYLYWVDHKENAGADCYFEPPVE